MTIKFESIRMEEDENLSNFYDEFSAISNSNFNLSGKILDFELVWKILGYLTNLGFYIIHTYINIASHLMSLHAVFFLIMGFVILWQRKVKWDSLFLKGLLIEY